MNEAEVLTNVAIVDYDLRLARTTEGIIWSKSLAAGLADVYPAISPDRTLPNTVWAHRYIRAINTNRKATVVVHVKSDKLIEFFELVLPHIKKPIVITAGDSDQQVFSGILTDAHLENGFPRDNRIYAVFSQNLTTQHPRAFPLPIGLNFHTVHRCPIAKWGMRPGQTPQAQEDELLSTSLAARPWPLRPPIVYAQYNLSNPSERRQCTCALRPLRAARFGPDNLRRRELWQTMAQYQFIASPPGNGLDCHRTWEALALGCVPIVKSVPTMSPLFANLPVWEVDDYSQVTDKSIFEKSQEIRARWAEGSYDWAKLRIPWWRKYLYDTISQLKRSAKIGY